MASDGKPESSDERKSSNPPDFSDHEQDLARNALIEFESARYDACLNSLSTLEGLRPKDVKVMHNKAVAEFYKSGCEKTDDLLKAFNNVKKKMKSLETETNSEATDVDRAILLYNKAVYCFYVKKYVEALENLVRLSKIVESLDKNLAQNVCFLLVEVCLITYQTEQATSVLNSLEKLLYEPAKQPENGNEDGVKKPESDIPKPDDQQKLRLHKYRARVHLLQKSIKACKKEIKTIMNVNNMDTEGLFIKSNFEYVRHNERKAVKILNSASKENQVLKTGECVSAMYFNNLGCLHFQMQKYNLASFYFRRAIAENEKALALIGTADKSNPLNSRPLCTLSLNCRYHLLYNLGVQMLHDGRPLVAFECLIESVQVYQSNPRLWLRLAECCIMAYQMSPTEEKTVDHVKKSDLVHSVVGTGPFRKIVLATPLENGSKNSPSSGSHSAAMPACNLHFGLLCLRNGLVLIPENLTAFLSEKDSTDADGNSPENETSSYASTSIPAAPSAPVKGQEIQQLKNSLLAGISYVSLVLGDYVLSLEHAQTLLSQPKLCGSLSFLGHMYAGEAMIQLGRIPEAISHLSPDNISGITSLGSNDQTTGSAVSQFPQSVAEARTTFLINLAGAHCLREEFDKAKKCLYQASSLANLKDLPPQTVALAIYIELQLGNPRGALQIIKRHQLLPPGKTNDKQRKVRKSFM